MSQPIKLPKLLQEGCVLQRGEKTRIWGWYKPQAELEVTFQEKVYRTKCDAEGTFETEISCEKTGGPYVLSIKSEDGQETVVKEVYVGDVFVCSGQSNMELPITRVREMFPDEPGNAMVHQYKVEECPVFTGALCGRAAPSGLPGCARCLLQRGGRVCRGDPGRSARSHDRAGRERPAVDQARVLVDADGPGGNERLGAGGDCGAHPFDLDAALRLAHVRVGGRRGPTRCDGRGWLLA